jgi:hypothetical protein
MSTDKPSRGPCVIACGVRSCGVDARRAFPMLCLSELIDLIEQIHDGHNNFLLHPLGKNDVNYVLADPPECVRPPPS